MVVWLSGWTFGVVALVGSAIKVLLLLDIGGSMDDHIAVCEALFGAAKSEFKRLEHFYFHNFIYGSLWRDHQLRMKPAPAVAGPPPRANNPSSSATTHSSTPGISSVLFVWK